MALRILYEKSLGDSSSWAPYIESMPIHVPSLLHYDEQELAELQMPSLASRAIATQEAVRKEYTRVSRLVTPSPSWGEWLWAVGAARSRTFELPAPGPGAGSLYGMFPVCDMLNHKFGSTSLRLDAARRVFEVAAAQPFAEGEQVVISYGAMGNEDLLDAYGFVDDENDVDAVDIPPATLIAVARGLWADSDGAALESDAEWAQRVEVLRRRHGGKGYRMFRSGEGEELMEAARILCAGRSDFQRVAAGPDGGRWAESLDLDSECRAWAAVAAACGEILESYPTTLEEDEALLAEVQEKLASEWAAAEGDSDSDQARAALERRFSAVLFRALKKALLREGSDRLEYYSRTSQAVGRVLEPSIMSVTA